MLIGDLLQIFQRSLLPPSFRVVEEGSITGRTGYITWERGGWVLSYRKPNGRCFQVSEIKCRAKYKVTNSH
jgi:hypothetical protein